MSPRQAWKKLGIEPTDDKRAIKKAYAAKLKAIDPDKDAKAFLTLREALQVAQWEADYGSSGEDDWSDDEAEGEAGEVATDDALADHESGLVERAGAAFEDEQPAAEEVDPADPQQHITHLLWSGDEDLSPWQQAALVDAVRALLADERMEQVGFAHEAEEWLGWTLVNSIPRSDPVVRLVVDHFEWAKRLDMVGVPYPVERLAQRAGDLAAMERLADPNHKWHGAWQRLRSPAPAKLSWIDKRRYGADVSGLIDSIRHHNPGLEWEVDHEHLALWDAATQAKGKTSGKRFWWWRWALAGWLVLQLIRFAGEEASNTPPSVPPVMPAVEIGSPAFRDWRADQAPRVQQWIDDNQSVISEIMARDSGEGLPSCAALEPKANLSEAEYQQCELAETKSKATRPSLTAPATATYQIPTSDTESRETRMIYSSPLWRSEQLPRVQGWMDSHRDDVDALLRPHVKSGRLPDCAKLAAAAGMSKAELDHCRVGQLRRRLQSLPQKPPVQIPEAKGLPLPVAPEPSPDVCAKGGLANSPICKGMEKNGDKGPADTPAPDPAP